FRCDSCGSRALLSPPLRLLPLPAMLLGGVFCLSPLMPCAAQGGLGKKPYFSAGPPPEKQVVIDRWGGGAPASRQNSPCAEIVFPMCPLVLLHFMTWSV